MGSDRNALLDRVYGRARQLWWRQRVAPVAAAMLVLVGLLSAPVLLRDSGGQPRKVAAIDQPTTTVEETTTTAVELAPTTLVVAPTTTVPPTTTTTEVRLPPVDLQPDPSRPPRAALRSHAGEVEAGQGSSCWSQPPAPDGTRQMLCADTFAYPESDATLPVRKGERLTLRFATDEQPNELLASVQDSDDGEGTPIAVAAANPTTFVLDVPPGPHRLFFSANWASGSGTWGVKVSVTR